MDGLRKVVRVALSEVAAFLLLPAWLWAFNRLDLNGWGFFHSGLPLCIVGSITY
jgi:hypothetical protein